MIGTSSFHSWRHSETLVNPAEIIVHEVKRDRMLEIFDFLGKGVSQSRESAHTHAHGQVLPFNVARRDNRNIGFANHPFFSRMEAYGGARASRVSFRARFTME